MAEKTTRTHAERDALLSKVFDSTLQTKDIEITEAGTMEITPDEGYFALKKVNLNVNVQGGNGDGGMVYLDASEMGIDIITNPEMAQQVMNYFPYIKVEQSVKKIVGNGAFVVGNLNSDDEKAAIVAFAYDESVVMVAGNNKMNVGEFLALSSFPQLPRLTKEEFYAL